jgi:hypothetical protein
MHRYPDLNLIFKMDVMIIEQNDGLLQAVPFIRFKLGYFDRETYFVIGGDTTGSCEEQLEPGFIAQRLGRLSELHDRLRLEIEEYLQIRYWPDEKYPDPDVILVTAPMVNFNSN